MKTRPPAGLLLRGTDMTLTEGTSDEGLEMGKLAMPKREFMNGTVHYGSPFVKSGVRLALCGATGIEKDQLRVRRKVTCSACALTADWVWQHRRGHGYGGPQ
jgi:hypothetical protein